MTITYKMKRINRHVGIVVNTAKLIKQLIATLNTVYYRLDRLGAGYDANLTYNKFIDDITLAHNQYVYKLMRICNEATIDLAEIHSENKEIIATGEYRYYTLNGETKQTFTKREIELLQVDNNAIKRAKVKLSDLHSRLRNASNIQIDYSIDS